jgi:fumarylacetoacetate (FAA) hydrolase
VEARQAPGRVEEDRVVELGASSLAAWLEAGGDDVGEHALGDVRLVAPVPQPSSVRDFYAFERHVRSARAQRGLEMAPEWYRIPVFYFSNPAAVYGPEDEIPFPPESSAWDYELEAAAVVGAEGRIAGFTVMNDWSARDLQKMEMAVGLGPAKGKDFATSLGPLLVTTDELGDLGLEMVARVNGEERSRGNLGDLHWPWEELAAHAARNTRLVAGDVLGSGTVGTGCILEHGDGRWLRPGDVVELEIEGIGTLRNRVAEAAVRSDPHPSHS